MFLSRALQKILSEKEVKKSQHTALRQACEAAISQIEADLKASGSNKKQDASSGEGSVGPNSPMPPPKAADHLVNVDKHFTPFKLACESKSPRIIRTALDSLQKLMAYGHITGNMLAELEGFPDAIRLVDLVVETICKCFVGETTDEGVQLQIIKALLTAVTSTTCEVHEGTLLKAVRTVYNINLTSRSAVNQATAKATLAQMINIIFQRMETLDPNTNFSSIYEDDEVGDDEAAEPSADVPVTADAAPIATTGLSEGAGQAEDTAEQSTEQATPEDKPDDKEGDAPVQPEAKDGDEDMSNGEAAADVGATTMESLAKTVVEDVINKALQQADSSKKAPSQDAASATENSVEPPASKSKPLPVSSLGSEEVNSSSVGEYGHELDAQGGYKLQKFGHVYRKDAFLVFRSMCKLSMKELSDKDATDARSHELRSKILSLELQLAILQNSGTNFRTDELFIDAIKQYLCVALSKNGVSHVPAVFELSLAIFLALLTSFKQHLKMQIEVFFREILLSMLEISTSSFQHKWLVVVCLSKICADAQTVIDLYLNYDCDEYLDNIFGRMINDLSRVAQGRASSELGATPQQEHNIKVKGLECLVSIMRCLDEWSSPLKEAESKDEDDKSESDAANSEAVSLDGSGITTPAEDIAAFETRKQKKELREAGIELFNRKPVKGVRFMQQHEFVGSEPEEVAQFLHSDSRLDKAAIGEYLGEGDDFNIKTMHAYVDQTNIKGTKDFLEALRLFLGSFRLPGEAQKIDRIMEKFAASYCEAHKDNGIFASADAAYVLAYSIIMLTTDLHNDKIKEKISKDSFLNMTRGINDNRDLPREFVSDIYDNIAKEAISLRGKTPSKIMGPELTNARARMQQYTEDSKTLEASATEAMNKAVKGGSTSEFLSATHIEHVRPMFKVAWTSLMAAFTVPLNASNDKVVVSLCIEGLRRSIHIACLFFMELEREAFIPALVKFTNLGHNNVSDLKPKNVEAIKCVLDVGIKEGNYLCSSWKDIMTVVSQLEQAQVLGSGAGHRPKARGENLSEAAWQEIVVATDKIFTTSRRLNGDAVVEFVTALCAVSMEELQANPPRTFSLAKTVEVAYYNMERIRLEWAHIWEVMGDYFNRVGCMSNTEVSFFAVDSLRQLSMKFLEKGELANYSFQKDFLRPFEYIMNHNKNVSIRDMVVRCVAQMVQSKASNIRSGWKNIFFVFSLAAADSDPNIVNMAFETTKHIFNNLFSPEHDHRASLIAASFMDAVNCMGEFACNPSFPKISMEAISHLRNCATTVSDVPDLFVDPNEDSKDEPKIWVKGWFPILFGLSRIINRCTLDVRTRAMTVMFEIMKTYGDRFLAQWWVDLFRVVFRMFDDKKLQSMSSEQERADWMSNTCTLALRAIVDVISQFFETLQPHIFADFLQLLSWCITCDNEQLARTGTESLHIFVMNSGSSFTDESWQLTTETLQSLFTETSPTELFEFDLPKPSEEAAEALASSVPSMDDVGLQEAEQGDAADAQPEDDAKTDTDATTDSKDDRKKQQKQPGKRQSQSKDESTERAAAAAKQTAATQGKSKQAAAEDAHRRRRDQTVFQRIIIKCIVQLELIQTVEWIVLSSTKPQSDIKPRQSPMVVRQSAATTASAMTQHRNQERERVLSKPLSEAGEMFQFLTTERLLVLLSCLEASHEFARRFNANVELRTALWKAGFMRNKSKPNLLKQETSSLSCALRILFRIYESQERKDAWEFARQRLFDVCGATFFHFANVVPKDTREIWSPLLQLIIRELLAMPDDRFRLHAKHHYSSLVECICLGYDHAMGDLAFMVAAFFDRCHQTGLDA